VLLAKCSRPKWEKGETSGVRTSFDKGLQGSMSEVQEESTLCTPVNVTKLDVPYLQQNDCRGTLENSRS
jgi:hypothetical protein